MDLSKIDMSKNDISLAILLKKDYHRIKLEVGLSASAYITEQRVDLGSSPSTQKG